jgi:hypothetical protein
MSRKSYRAISDALGGGEAVNRLTKAMERIFGKSEDRIKLILEQITSLQACKDAALTGEEDLQIIAVCRLGEYGKDAFESLDIALNDENPVIRTLAAGMLACTGRNDAIPILRHHSVENSQAAREMVEFSIEWLTKHRKDVKAEKVAPKSLENPAEILLETDTIPLRTTDEVLVINNYVTTPVNLEYGLTIRNEGKNPIYSIMVKILAYPLESIQPVNPLSQSIDSIEPGESESLVFYFKVIDECVEGEIITSVNLVDSTGEELSAKSGNVFIRALFEQFTPLKIDSDEFIHLKQKMRHWNREHTLLAEGRYLFESFLSLLETKNFHLFKKDVLERDGTFMGMMAGIAKGKFRNTKLAVSITIVGTIGKNLSKVRIDVFSESSDLLQTAASELFETILTSLGVLDEEYGL